MPKIARPLTNTEIKSAKSTSKDYSLHDGCGLYLLVKSNGSKIWRFSYTRPGIRQRALISFGKFPTVSLASARRSRDDAKTLLSMGIDPQRDREAKVMDMIAKKESIFSNMAAEWLELKKTMSIRKATETSITQMLEKHILPTIGNVPVGDLSARHIIRAFDYLRKSGKIRTLNIAVRKVKEVLDYAVNSGVIAYNPAQNITKAIASYQTTPYKTIKARELPGFWASLDNVIMERQTRLLIEWLMLTMVRPNEACGARWDEIDIANKVWEIPAERMKSKRTHVVALSSQAINILEEVKRNSFGGVFVFASPRKSLKPMNNGTISNVLQRARVDMVPHGFRALASTTLNEHGFNPDVIEAALAHTDRNPIRRTYNRSTYIEQRVKLMQWWGDFLEGSKSGNITIDSGENGLKAVM
ncbi:integrase [Lelliottia aquatilis]|uniref:tyrosine-type recombinase/integrase n=1 Tax=Lelliottia aquatilis TaxID=2080838 RepID=UPI000CDEBD49|nr:tyrosine-type recombinase/integrase [Lelliottia aquatilis]POZ13523.1 integrase [Lelliottia aquatilis]